MASDDKKTKADPAPKKEAAAKDKGAPPPADKGTIAKDKPKPAADTPADPAAGYSRGEGQKPVSKAYKDNWDAIFGKKKKR